MHKKLILPSTLVEMLLKFELAGKQVDGAEKLATGLKCTTTEFKILTYTTVV